MAGKNVCEICGEKLENCSNDAAYYCKKCEVEINEK
jgi:tRNA(Ile2) C34 agmatinyltransferase TiaS